MSQLSTFKFGSHELADITEGSDARTGVQLLHSHTPSNNKKTTQREDRGSLYNSVLINITHKFTVISIICN